MNASLVLLATAALLLAVSSPSAGFVPNLDQTAPPKDVPPVTPVNASRQSTGEDIDTAIPIPGLPFTVIGNTCDYAHDYDEVCPYGGIYAPDVVYSYAPPYEESVDISLCDSGYDTKVYVYEDDIHHVIACNDDACGSDGYRSELFAVPMAPGHTYYVVVDGYGSQCGEYLLEMNAPIHELLTCPSGARLEGEPDCYDDYDDQYNSGCSALPEPLFSPLYGTIGGEHFDVCGTAGTFRFGSQNYRDTDWYRLTVTEPNTIAFECHADFPVQILLLDGSAGCENAPILASDTAGYFPDVAMITYACDPGEYWFWVGPSVFDAIPCGSLYVVGVDGFTLAPISTEPASWSVIKGQHR